MRERKRKDFGSWFESLDERFFPFTGDPADWIEGSRDSVISNDHVLITGHACGDIKYAMVLVVQELNRGWSQDIHVGQQNEHGIESRLDKRKL